MSRQDAQSFDASAEKLLRVQSVVDDCIERRIRGDELTDGQVLCEHADLMPELGEELRNLAVIERARRRAASSTGAGFATTVDSVSPPTRSDGPPVFLPGYEILDEIHRGGQGVVYRAMQQATQREVAVKILLGGALTGPREMVRFEREVRILGSLRHENIVTIHDSGVAAGGSAYLVMDYIAGEPLDVFVEKRRPAPGKNDEVLTLNDLLRMFVIICDAINAAHLHGVIHRDIKPSNIRVDAEGRPHVLDFGLAKQAADEHDVGIDCGQTMTLPGQFVGSLPWTSPEQAAGKNRAIDLRCDVYSVGVTLYQMLTGRLPYDMVGSMSEVLDRVIHVEASRPSSAAGSDGFRPFAIDDDVDTIVLKCLDKDPDRRYQTAGEVARDLDRYLTGQPIEAKRDSGFYVLRKTLGRHKIAVTVTAAFLMVIVSSVAALAVMYSRQSKALIETATARDAEREARNEAESANRFLKSMIAAPDPYRTDRSALTVEEVLDQAAATLEAGFAGQPLVEAQIRMTLGETYRNLAARDEARAQFEAALAIHRRELGDEHPLIATSMTALALTLDDNGEYERSGALLTDALAMRRRLYGQEHKDVAETMSYLGQSLSSRARYADAERMYRSALAMQRKLLPDPHDATALTLSNLGVLLNRLGRLDDAESSHQAALEMRRQLAPDSLSVVQSLSNLAEVSRQRGSLRHAESLHREALALRRQRLPANHPDIALTLSNLGALLHELGEIDEAELMLREALALQRNAPGGPHSALGSSLNNLARLLIEKLQYAQAEELLREGLGIVLAAYGPDHDYVAKARINLAELLNRKGEHESAEDQFRLALQALRKTLGDKHPVVGVNLNNLAIMLQSLGRSSEAEPLIREAIEIFRLHFGEEHANVAHGTNTLGVILMGLGDVAGAEDAFARALARRRELFGGEHEATAGSMHNLGAALLERAAYPDAAPLLREALRVRRKLLAKSHPETAGSLHMLGLLLVRRGESGDFEEAERLLRECVEMRKEVLRPDHWQIADSRSVLGQCLGQMGRFEQAEAMLLDVLDAAGDDPSCPSRVESETVARLVELFENSNRPGEAQKWRASRAP